MSDLPEPVFIEQDPVAITTSMIAKWESLTGKSLYPAQVDRLQIDHMAFRETLVRVGIQEAAKQNLLAFAVAPMIDYLGELVDTPRLPAQAARTTVRLTFTAAADAAFQVPVGYRIETDSGVQFATVATVEVAVGQLSVDSMMAAAVPGADGNGYLPGQLSVLVDELEMDVESAANLSTTLGGIDVEDDERYRARIALAPELFSWGSDNRYKRMAMDACAELVDVQVFSPTPDGAVVVVLLGQGGVISQEAVSIVAATLDEKRNRMLGDRVTVRAATQIDFNLIVEIDVLSSSVPNTVLAMVRQRLQAWSSAKAAQLGGDLVPAQPKTALGGITGLYDIRVIEPSEKRVLAVHEWPHLVNLDVRLGKIIDDA